MLVPPSGDGHRCTSLQNIVNPMFSAALTSHLLVWKARLVFWFMDVHEDRWVSPVQHCRSIHCYVTFLTWIRSSADGINCRGADSSTAGVSSATHYPHLWIKSESVTEKNEREKNCFFCCGLETHRKAHGWVLLGRDSGGEGDKLWTPVHDVFPLCVCVCVLNLLICCCDDAVRRRLQGWVCVREDYCCMRSAQWHNREEGGETAASPDSLLRFSGD